MFRGVRGKLYIFYAGKSDRETRESLDPRGAMERLPAWAQRRCKLVVIVSTAANREFI
jgi:hypothetical protein